MKRSSLIAPLILGFLGLVLIVFKLPIFNNAQEDTKAREEVALSQSSFEHLSSSFNLSSLPKPVTPPAPPPPQEDPFLSLKQWTLIGIIQNDTEQIALLQKGNELKNLRQGQELGGFVIEEITVDEVSFRKDELTYSLYFK